MRQKRFIGTTNRLLSVVLTGLLVVSTVGLSACGNKKMTAIVMRLMKSEGQVVLTDEKDAEKSMLENMNLYSGYHLKTGSDGEVKINMDDTRLVTLANNSLLGFEKENKAMRLALEEGEMFFNVTEKLSEDESLDLESSTMIVGIRGTFGTLTPNEVTLIFGHIDLKIKNPETGIEDKLELNSGEKLVVKESAVEDGKWTYAIDKVEPKDLSPLAKEEIASDGNLAQKVMDGYDLTPGQLEEQLGQPLSPEVKNEEGLEDEDADEEGEEEEETQEQTQTTRRQAVPAEEETDPNEMTPEQLAAAQAQLAKEIAEQQAAAAAAAATPAAEETQEPAGPTATTVSLVIGSGEAYMWEEYDQAGGGDSSIWYARINSADLEEVNMISDEQFTGKTYPITYNTNNDHMLESATITVYIAADGTPSYIIVGGSQINFVNNVATINEITSITYSGGSCTLYVQGV